MHIAQPVDLSSNDICMPGMKEPQLVIFHMADVEELFSFTR